MTVNNAHRCVHDHVCNIYANCQPVLKHKGAPHNDRWGEGLTGIQCVVPMLCGPPSQITDPTVWHVYALGQLSLLSLRGMHSSAVTNIIKLWISSMISAIRLFGAMLVLLTHSMCETLRMLFQSCCLCKALLCISQFCLTLTLIFVFFSCVYCSLSFYPQFLFVFIVRFFMINK